MASPDESPRRLATGDRVRAANFVLDEGLRIWPLQDDPDGRWRVVDVADQAVRGELMRGPFHDCQRAHPDAVPGINDNESVPPGTLGTVDHVDADNLFVRWDNGRRLGVTDADLAS